MPDRRECILNKNLGEDFIATAPDIDIISFKDAMDEYFTERALELLGYMAENGYECCVVNKEHVFLRKLSVGWEALKKEQLFENFL